MQCFCVMPLKITLPSIFQTIFNTIGGYQWWYISVLQISYIFKINARQLNLTAFPKCWGDHTFVITETPCRNLSNGNQSHTPASFSLKTLSYSSVTCTSLSLSILSQIRVTCFNVKRGWSLRGGEDPGEYEEKVLISGELGTLRCFRLWSRLHSWWILAETWSKKL